MTFTFSQDKGRKTYHNISHNLHNIKFRLSHVECYALFYWNANKGHKRKEEIIKNTEGWIKTFFTVY